MRFRMAVVLLLSFLLVSCSPSAGQSVTLEKEQRVSEQTAMRETEAVSESEMQISPTNSNFLDLAISQYSEDQLKIIADYGGNLEQLHSHYPIECIRKVQDSFRVAYRGENQVSIVYFDANGKKTLGRVCDMLCKKSVFEGARGCSLTEIMQMDPTGDYTFIYAGRNDSRESRHFTSDGYIVHVFYDETGFVTDIKEELI